MANILKPINLFVYAEKIEDMRGEIMREIVIVSKNEVGTLASIAEALGNVGVNIEAISAYESNNRAVFRVVTNDIATALKTLSKIGGSVQATESPILLLKLINRPGELGKVTRKLANRGVNLESLYIVNRANEYTDVAIKPSAADFEKAKDVLGLR